MRDSIGLLALGLGLAMAATGCDTSGDGSIDTSEDGGSQDRRDGAIDDDDPLPSSGAGGDDPGSTRDGSVGQIDDEDAGGGGSDPITDNAVDPAPQRTTPGEYGCTGCPDADVTNFTLDLGDATSETFMGTVTDAVGNGEFYLESADGQSIAGPIETGASGDYMFTIPLFCGTQTLKCLWSNDAGTYVAVVEITTSGCIAADMRITLTWDDLGSDYELHLIKEGGRINDNATDCTWTSCIGAGPDWGVTGDPSDDPLKDVDNTGMYGPENIFYPMPESGTYTVMVEHWGAGTADSDGQVTINLIGEAPVVIPITNLASHFVFTAATIEWPAKTVTAIGTHYDCTANWSGGCLDMIP